MLPSLFSRQARRSVVIEFNPHQVLVAGITRPRRGPVVIECAAEFAAMDTGAIRDWLDRQGEFRRNWTSAICGYVPQQALVQRENLQAEDLTDPARLGTFIAEQQARRAGSSAPFRGASAEDWLFRAVHADDGSSLEPGLGPQPALVVGIARHEIRHVEQRVLDCRLVPGRIEPTLLPLFGSIYELMARRHQSDATVVVVVQDEITNIYILGKEGVHTPATVPYGLSALVQQVRRDGGHESDEAALRHLKESGPELRKRAPRLLRGLAGALRPAVDSYEMTTGQPVGPVHCAYLPPALAWLADPLATAVGHEAFVVECRDWMRSAGLETAPGVAPLGPHWLGALSLAAYLPENATLELEKGLRKGASFHRSWHVDSRQPMEVADAGPVRRGFVAAAVAGLAMVLSLTFAAWQWQVSHTLAADTAYWQDQMNANRELFTELTQASAKLEANAARLDQAHALMRTPFPPSDFIMHIGRSLPPRMRIDRIEANAGRVVLAGSLLEPAEEASRSLGHYLDSLRRAPEFRGRFTSITATSLQRTRDDDALAFEVTLRLPAATP